jgi:hypothetical protein
VVAQRREEHGEKGDGRGDGQPKAHEQQREQRQDRGHVPRDRNVEDRAVARGRLERGSR